MRFQVSIFPAVVGYFLSIKNVIAGAEESPPLPGILPGEGATKIIIAGDIDYPPYSYLGPASEDFPLVGFAVDFLYGLTEVCDIEPYVVQTDVSQYRNHVEKNPCQEKWCVCKIQIS